MFEELEKLKQELDDARLQKEQTEHQINRLSNRLESEKKAERTKRNHRLCYEGANLEIIFPRIKAMNEAQFIQFCSALIELPGVRKFAKDFVPDLGREVNK